MKKPTVDQINEVITKGLERFLSSQDRVNAYVPGHEGHEVYRLPFDKERMRGRYGCMTCQLEVVEPLVPAEFITLTLEITDPKDEG